MLIVSADYRGVLRLPVLSDDPRDDARRLSRISLTLSRGPRWLYYDFYVAALDCFLCALVYLLPVFFLFNDMITASSECSATEMSVMRVRNTR